MNLLKKISFKQISVYILISLFCVFLTKILKSDFIFQYLRDNIITLLVTLLAINTATLGLIASKIQDLISQYKGISFKETIDEMKLSLLEQIILIIISFLTLVIQDSPIINFEYKETICNIILTFVLVYSISILWDTGNAVFVSIEEIEKMNKEE